MDYSTIAPYFNRESLTLVGGLAGLFVTYKVGRWAAGLALRAARSVASVAVLSGAMVVGGGGLIGLGADTRVRRDGDPPLPALTLPARAFGAARGVGIVSLVVGASLGAPRVIKWMQANL